MVGTEDERDWTIEDHSGGENNTEDDRDGKEKVPNTEDGRLEKAGLRMRGIKRRRIKSHSRGDDNTEHEGENSDGATIEDKIILRMRREEKERATTMERTMLKMRERKEKGPQRKD